MGTIQSYATRALAYVAGVDSNNLVSKNIIRELLATNRTYYIRTDGSNTNNGRTNTAGGAFLTLQGAWNVVSSTLDFGGFTVTFQVGSGTFDGVDMSSSWLGGGAVSWLGDLVTPSNVIIDATSLSISFGNFSVLSGGQVNIDGFRIQGDIAGFNTGIFADGGVLYVLGNNGVANSIEYGNIGFVHQWADGGSILNNVSYKIVGSGGSGSSHQLAQFGTSIISFAPGVVASVIGAQSFTTFVVSTACASIWWSNSNSVNLGAGSVTGKRYDVELNATVNTNGGGANFFPGTIAGTTDGYGVYA